MAAESDHAAGIYQRDILQSRRRLREALSNAQTNHDDHSRPLFHQTISGDALQAHQLVIDLVGEIAPRKGEVPELWTDQQIAVYQHPVRTGRVTEGATSPLAGAQGRGQGIGFRPAAVVGLGDLLEWRNVHLPKEQAYPGDSSANARVSTARAFMPVDVLSGARHEIDNALAALGWLPEGDPTDFMEQEPSI